MPATTAKGFPYPIGTDKIRTLITTFKALTDKLNADVGVVRSGSAVVNTVTGSSVTLAVNFSSPLPGTPNVTVTPFTSNPQQVALGVSGLTADGFNIHCYRNAGTPGNLNIQYLARY